MKTVPFFFFLLLISFQSFSQQGIKTNLVLEPFDGDQALGQIYNNSACGLNWVYADVLIQTRSQQYGFNIAGTGLPTTISISGLNSSSQIERAYLWYFASYQSPTAPATSVNITNPIGGNNIYPAIAPVGTSGDVCWQEVGSAVYRVDVTTNINGSGNYLIGISGFANPNWEVNGASLLIIYRDSAATYQGSMVINDGNMACGSFNGYANPQSATMGGINACDSSTSGTAFLIVADMQENINGGSHPAVLNGVSGNYPNDFWCYDKTSTMVTSGQTNAQFSVDGLGMDCYIFGVMGLYYQTTTCVVCPDSSTVGIQNLNEEINLSVYPNPTKGQITITGSISYADEINIYDVFGKLVFHEVSASKEKTFNTGLPRGIYFYQIESGSKILSRGKLLVE